MTSDLEQRFATLAETLAQLTTEFKYYYVNLNKNSMERVSMAFIEYPTPAEKRPATDQEQQLTNLSFKIKETQMAMAVIHSIMQQGEENGE